MVGLAQQDRAVMILQMWQAMRMMEDSTHTTVRIAQALI
jgi:hypothetical protein